MKTDPRHVLKDHILTERTSTMKQKNNEYVFEVDKRANKFIVKSAVEMAFKVKVEDVRTMTMPGKSRRMNRVVGKSATWKKAIVRLKAGQNIEIFENV
jgi:large subunit ribosomal protein L23